METVLVPALPSTGDAPVAQILAHLLEAAAPQGLLQYLLLHGSDSSVNLQAGTLLPLVTDLDPIVADGSFRAEEEVLVDVHDPVDKALIVLAEEHDAALADVCARMTRQAGCGGR